MVYRKKPVVKRRPYKRSYKRPTRKSARSSVVAIVKKQLAKSFEKKVCDPVFSLAGTTIDFAANNNITSNAWEALDLNPDISQGIGDNQRIGNRCAITSGHIQIQLSGMTQATSPINYKICLVLRKNVSTSESPGTTVKNLFAPNVFTQLIDSDSGLLTSNLANYQIIRTLKGRIAPSQIIQPTGFPVPQYKNVTMGFKFKTPLVQRYTSDASTETTRNDMILVFLAGNESNTNLSTGISAKFYSQFYFQDA